MDWPNDADGDVFRRLVENGFDFSEPHTVDYNVDFDVWPPAQTALDTLRSLFGAIEVIDPDDDFGGYVQRGSFLMKRLHQYSAVLQPLSPLMAVFANRGASCKMRSNPSFNTAPLRVARTGY